MKLFKWFLIIVMFILTINSALAVNPTDFPTTWKYEAISNSWVWRTNDYSSTYYLGVAYTETCNLLTPRSTTLNFFSSVDVVDTFEWKNISTRNETLFIDGYNNITYINSNTSQEESILVYNITQSIVPIFEEQWKATGGLSKSSSANGINATWSMTFGDNECKKFKIIYKNIINIASPYSIKYVWGVIDPFLFSGKHQIGNNTLPWGDEMNTTSSDSGINNTLTNNYYNLTLAKIADAFIASKSFNDSLENASTANWGNAVGALNSTGGALNGSYSISFTTSCDFCHQRNFSSMANDNAFNITATVQFDQDSTNWYEFAIANSSWIGGVSGACFWIFDNTDKTVEWRAKAAYVTLTTLNFNKPHRIIQEVIQNTTNNQVTGSLYINGTRVSGNEYLSCYDTTSSDKKQTSTYTKFVPAMNANMKMTLDDVEVYNATQSVLGGNNVSARNFVSNQIPITGGNASSYNINLSYINIVNNSGTFNGTIAISCSGTFSQSTVYTLQDRLNGNCQTRGDRLWYNISILGNGTESVTIREMNGSYAFDSLITNIGLVSPLDYHDLDTDGINFGVVSEGWTSGESTIKHLNVLNRSEEMFLIMRVSEVNGALSIYSGSKAGGSQYRLGTIPANAASPNIYNVFIFDYNQSVIQTSNGSIQSINITQTSGAETVYIDWIAFAPKRNASVIRGGVHNASTYFMVIVNATVTNGNAVDLLRILVSNTTQQINNTNGSSKRENVKDYGNFFGVVATPIFDGNLTFAIIANSSNPVLPNQSSVYNVTLIIDGTTPVINTITRTVNELIGRTYNLLVNSTEVNPYYVEVTSNLDGTTINLTLNGANGTTNNFNLTNINDHTLTIRIWDRALKSAETTTVIHVSNYSMVNSSFAYRTAYSRNNNLTVDNAITLYPQQFRLTVTTTSTGTANITNLNLTRNIEHDNITNVSIVLVNLTVINLSTQEQVINNINWTTDEANGSETITNYIDYLIKGMIEVEWENTGTDNRRLIHVISHNKTVNLTEAISLSIPIRTAFQGSVSSLDLFYCSDGINFGAGTCNQWTEITATYYEQTNEAWHYGTSVSSFPTIDTNGDGTKDIMMLKIPHLSEWMFYMDNDNNNAEVVWSAGASPEGADVGGGGGDESEPALTTIPLGSTVSDIEVKGEGGFLKFLRILTGIFDDIGDWLKVTWFKAKVNLSDTVLFTIMLIMFIAGVGLILIQSQKKGRALEGGFFKT